MTVRVSGREQVLSFSSFIRVDLAEGWTRNEVFSSAFCECDLREQQVNYALLVGIWKKEENRGFEQAAAIQQPLHSSSTINMRIESFKRFRRNCSSWFIHSVRCFPLLPSLLFLFHDRFLSFLLSLGFNFLRRPRIHSCSRSPSPAQMVLIEVCALFFSFFLCRSHLFFSSPCSVCHGSVSCLYNRRWFRVWVPNSTALSFCGSTCSLFNSNLSSFNWYANRQFISSPLECGWVEASF